MSPVTPATHTNDSKDNHGNGNLTDQIKNITVKIKNRDNKKNMNTLDPSVQTMAKFC